MKALGPDEISELAEFLWTACAAAENKGRKVQPGYPVTERTSYSCCPLGAATGLGYPNQTLIRQYGLDFGEIDIDFFIAGFDFGKEVGHGQHPLEVLGRRFREQALSGEGFK